MSDAQLDFAALTPVNHLWPAFVERLGTDAQRAVRQALDLQGMRGHDGTLPVLFVETGGLALASTDLVREQTGLNAHGDRMVLLLSSRDQVIQLLQQA
jgi:predicted naringenin-chalcone synthase